jgi:membrane-bound lytic murein transglycosylase D
VSRFQGRFPSSISRLLPALLALLVVSSGMASELPRPKGLAPDVSFWRRIFAEVSTDEALIHDNRYLGIVYEKISMAGASDGAQAREMDEVRERYIRLLEALANGERQSLGAAGRRVLELWPGASNDELRAAAGRVRAQEGLADRFRQGLVRSGRWEDHIQDQLRAAGVPAGLAALPHVESSFNPEARSYVGAAGLWQFTACTGRRFMMINDAVDERRDPFRSSEAAARLLKSNYAVLGTWPLAITAYNSGTGGMSRAVRTLGTRNIETILRNYDGPTFGFASRNFYVSFLAAEEVARRYRDFFGPVERDAAESWRTVEVPHYLGASTLSATLGISMEDLRSHNPALLPVVWEGRRPVPRGFDLRLPPGVASETAVAQLAAVPESRQARPVAVRSARSHRVRPGESLSRVASRYGVSTSQLARLNGITSKNLIRVGQVLKVPGGRGSTEVAAATPRKKGNAGGRSTYVVRNGDNLALIAKRTGVPQRQLMAINSINNPNRILPGQRLRLQHNGSN